MPEHDRPSAAGPVILPQTYEQEWFAFRSLMYPGEAFPLWIACDIGGPLDSEAFSRAVDDLIERHDAMRATYFWSENGQPRQRIDREGKGGSIRYQWIACDSRQQFEAYVRAVARRDATTAWDLDREPPYRFRLLKYSDDSHLFLATLNHIAFDLTAAEILHSELWRCYARHMAGQERTPLPPPGDLIEAVRGQRARWDGRAAEANARYWQRRHAVAPPVWQRAATAGVPRQREQDRVSLPACHGAAYVERLRLTCGRLGCSVFELSLCVFAWLAFQLSRQDRLAVYITFDSRGTDKGNLVGMFSGVHPVVLDRPRADLRTFLGQVRKEILRALVHRHAGGDEMTSAVMRQWSRWQTEPRRALTVNYFKMGKSGPSDPMVHNLKITRRARRSFAPAVGGAADALHLIIREYEDELEVFREFNPYSLPEDLADAINTAFADALVTADAPGAKVAAIAGPLAAGASGREAALVPLLDRDGMACMHVDCAEVSGILVHHPNVISADVRVDQHADGGSELVAYVRTAGSVSDDELREFCREWPEASPFAITPGRICRLQVADGQEPAGPAAGGGAPGSPDSPGEDSRAMVSLMMELLPGSAPDSEFWAAGGTVAIITELARRATVLGLPAPGVADFAGPRTLAAAARAILSRSVR